MEVNDDGFGKSAMKERQSVLENQKTVLENQKTILKMLEE